MMRHRAALLFVSLAAVCCLIAGCSPNTFFHPSGHLGVGGSSLEAGFSTASVPGGGEILTVGENNKSNQQSIDIQAALGFRSSKHFSARMIGFGGTASGFGFGLAPRVHLLGSDRADIGLEAQLGLLWLSGSLPMSFAIVDNLWLYTQPSVGLRFNTSAYQLPIGLLFNPIDGFGLMFVMGLDSKPTSDPESNFDKLPDVVRFGLGISVQFGGASKAKKQP